MTQFDYDPLTFPGPALPASCYRALHSFVLEAVLDMSDDQRHDIVERCAGLPSWDRFMLAVFQGRLKIDIVSDATTLEPFVWVHYPRHGDEMAWPITAVHYGGIGADPDLLQAELNIRVQVALDHIVALGEEA